MTATANINDNGRPPLVRENSDGVTAVRCLNQPQTITFNLSKRLAQSWGQDREHVFKKNKDGLNGKFKVIGQVSSFNEEEKDTKQKHSIQLID